MQLEELCCNNCGAPLSVPARTNFVTCNHCSTRLAVRRTESTTFTGQIERIDSKQNEMLHRLDRIEQQNSIADLDREWADEQQQYMIAGKEGRKHLPSYGAVVGGICAAVFGLFWTVFAGAMFPSMALFGIIFIVAAIASSIFSFVRIQEYDAARRRHKRRRRELSRTRSRQANNTYE